MATTLLFLLISLVPSAFLLGPFAKCNQDGWTCENGTADNLSYTCTRLDYKNFNTFTISMLPSRIPTQLNIRSCSLLSIDWTANRNRQLPKFFTVKDVKHMDFKKSDVNYGHRDYYYDDYGNRRYGHHYGTNFIPPSTTLENVQSAINLNALYFDSRNSGMKSAELTLINVGLECFDELSVQHLNWTNVVANCAMGSFHSITISWNGVSIDSIKSIATDEYLAWKTVQIKSMPESVTAGEIHWENVTAEECNSTFQVESLIWENFVADTLNATFTTPTLVWINVTIGLIDSTFHGALDWQNVQITNAEYSSIRVKGYHVWSGYIGIIPTGFYSIVGSSVLTDMKVEAVSEDAINVENGNFTITDSEIGLLEGNSINVQTSEKIILKKNNILKISKRSLVVKTNEFSFNENNVTELVGRGFNVLSARFYFENNLFGLIRAEAFSGIRCNFSHDTNPDHFHYLWKGNQVMKMDCNALQPDFLTFHNQGDRIEFVENSLPCICPTIAWSPENQAPIHKYLYDILQQKEHNNTCTNIPGCSLDTISKSITNGRCLFQISTCPNFGKDKTIEGTAAPIQIKDYNFSNSQTTPEQEAAQPVVTETALRSFPPTEVFHNVTSYTMARDGFSAVGDKSSTEQPRTITKEDDYTSSTFRTSSPSIPTEKLFPKTTVVPIVFATPASLPMDRSRLTAHKNDEDFPAVARENVEDILKYISSVEEKQTSQISTLVYLLIFTLISTWVIFVYKNYHNFSLKRNRFEAFRRRQVPEEQSLTSLN